MGTVYIDSMQFAYTSESNFIVNSNFENYTRGIGVADGWANWESQGVLASYQSEDRYVTSGKRAQKMSSTALNGGSMALLQALAVESNQPYRLDGQVHAAELNNAQTKLTVAFYDASGNAIAWHSGKAQIEKTGGYLSKELTGVVPANAKSAMIHVYLHSTGSGGSGTVYIDSVQFVYTSESNFIVNSSFENYTRGVGVADGWANWGKSRSSGKLPE